MLEKLRQLLHDNISDALNRFVHYDVKMSVALVFTQLENAEAVINEHIRPTDKIIKLSQHLFTIIYQYTNTDEEAEAATENLAKRLGGEGKSIIAYTTFHESDKNPDVVVTRLYHIFEDLFSKNRQGVGSDKEYFKELEKFTIDVDKL